MNLPDWVSETIVIALKDPATGDWFEVTYQLAPPTKQLTMMARVEEPTDADSFKEQRRKFMNYVIIALGFSSPVAKTPAQHKSKEKLWWGPVDDVLRKLWEQHYQAKHGLNYDPDVFYEKEWNGPAIKLLRYQDYCRSAIVSIMGAAKKEAIANGMTIKNPNSLPPFVETVYQRNPNKMWLRDAWENWKTVNPVEARELSAKLSEL